MATPSKPTFGEDNPPLKRPEGRHNLGLASVLQGVRGYVCVLQAARSAGICGDNQRKWVLLSPRSLGDRGSTLRELEMPERPRQTGEEGQELRQEMCTGLGPANQGLCPKRVATETTC